MPRNPTTGIADCCARAASGNAAPNPATTAMKSRRRITQPRSGIAFGLSTQAHQNRDLRPAKCDTMVSLRCINFKPHTTEMGRQRLLPRRTIYSRFTSISRHTCQARVLWLAAEECLGLRKTGPLSNLAGSPGRREERGASPTWDHIELNAGRLHVRRAKNGIPSTYPIRGDEIRALRRLQRENAHKCPYVFVSERGG